MCASRTVQAPAVRKNAACARYAASSIIPSSSTIVSMSTACRERFSLWLKTSAGATTPGDHHEHGAQQRACRAGPA